MRITRLGHAALLVETPGARVLLDPGVFSADEAFALRDLDAVVVTHQHPDHLDPGRAVGLVESNPGAVFLSDPETAQQQGGPWQSHVDGDVTEVGDVSIAAVGERHAEILPTLPRIANVGVVVTGPGSTGDDLRLFHPGDSYETVPADVDVLALPLAAPWARVADTVAFLRSVAPGAFLPIHDGTVSDQAYGAYWGHVADHGGVDADHAHRVAPGDTLDV